MQPWNIKTVIRRIWNQNFTQLVSTKLVTKNHIYIHILSSDGQMTTRLYQRIAVSLLRELIFGKSIFVYETSNLLHVCNKAFLSNLFQGQRVYFMVLYSICNSYGVLLDNLFHPTAFLKRWHHWRRRKFTWEKHETFD